MTSPKVLHDALNFLLDRAGSGAGPHEKTAAAAHKSALAELFSEMAAPVEHVAEAVADDTKSAVETVTDSLPHD